MHQQDAYVAEKGEIGGFTVIGYDKPASTVFTYDETTSGTTKEVFTATPKSPLDGISDAWTVESTIGSSGAAKHEAKIPTGGEKLTPNFTSIGAGTL